MISPAPSAPATEAACTLARVRIARDAGNLSECLRLAAVCVYQAEADRDAESGYHALAAAGRLHYGRSEPGQAVLWFTEANAWARGYRLGQWIAPSYHDLFLAYTEAEKRREAWRAFGEALDAYGPSEPRLSCLHADKTLERMRAGDAVDAYHAFRAAGSTGARAKDRACVLENMVEAASMFSKKLFEEHWPTLYSELYAPSNGECFTRLLIGAAESGLRMGRNDEARALATRGVECASARHEDSNAERAASLL